MLWHYAYGKPLDRIEVADPHSVGLLTDDGLRARLRAALVELGE